LKRKIITTADGSTTIHLPDWNEQYHSKHGAVQEAYHVFIDAGLALFSNQEVAILEIGFGTGLNALISLIEAKERKLTIGYTGVEKYPVAEEEIAQLNYLEIPGAALYTEAFELMHQSSWDQETQIATNFTLTKEQKDFNAIDTSNLFNLIYFDAFGASVQPKLWTSSIFLKMFVALKSKGILVTYSAKGSVRRAMQEVGFIVERCCLIKRSYPFFFTYFNSFLLKQYC